jgi:hypothetical protein
VLARCVDAGASMRDAQRERRADIDTCGSEVLIGRGAVEIELVDQRADTRVDP